MKQVIRILTILTMIGLPVLAHAAEQATTPRVASAYFVNIKDGDTITSPALIKFGVEGMEIAPAGTEKAGTGHFHLLIDTTLTEEQKKYAIPNDDQHKHFGKGQTETTLDLTPGKHTLQLVMGDGAHMLHNPPVMSDVITVNVKEQK